MKEHIETQSLEADCKHERNTIVCGGGGTSQLSTHRHGVTVCLGCGQIHVYAQRDGVDMEVNFYLWTDDAIKAASLPNRLSKEENQ